MIHVCITGAISPALSMHPGIPPHLQQLQAHLLRSGGLLPPLHPQPGLYHPLSSPAELLNPKQEVSLYFITTMQVNSNFWKYLTQNEIFEEKSFESAFS